MIIAKWILIVIIIVNIIINAYKDGEARSNYSLVSTIIATVISCTLYYFLGVFSVLGL